MPASVQYAQQPAGSATDLGLTIDALTAKTTPVDADEIGLSDSAASEVGKKATFTQMWTNYFKGKADALYQPLKTILTTLGALANGAGALTNNGSGTLSWVAVPAAGQPIPSSSTYAVGTMITAFNFSGPTANGATQSGANLRRLGDGSSTLSGTTGAAPTGTWTNISGVSIGTSGWGYWVRTA